MKTTLPVGLLALVTLCPIRSAPAGDIDPPGAPEATPGPEPRVAINSVNTPGDDESHFRIAESGSYYLEGNHLFLGTEEKHGILIEASNVTLDLSGFTLDGWNPIAVPHPNSSLSGVMASFEMENITVHSGTVRDWGESGIDLSNARSTLVEGIGASDNDSYGVRTGVGSVVHGCTASQNGAAGIRMSSTGTVMGCTTIANGGAGISAAGSNTVSGCAARENIGPGITVAGGSTVNGCVALNNEAGGIVGSRAIIVNCTASFNSVEGIRVEQDSLVLENLCANTPSIAGDRVGIRATASGNRIEGNTVHDHNTGIGVDGTDNLIIRNSARGNGTDYDIGLGNTVGPIITSGGTILSNNPWANFEL